MSPNSDRSPAASVHRWARRAAIPALIAMTLAAYANSLSAPFVLDDLSHIVENPLIRDLGYFTAPEETAGAAADPVQKASFRSRPVATWTFALDYRLHALDVTGYHVTNIVIHLLSGLLLYALVRRTLALPILSGSPLGARAPAIAWFVAAIFLVHPLQTQAVTYVVQRMASLAALLCLLSLLGYAEARRSNRKTRAAALYTISLAALVAAMFTKENAATFPLIVVLYELTFFDGRLRRRILRLLPWAATMAIVPWRQIAWSTANGLEIAASATHPGAEISRLDYLLTQLRVVVTYLRLLVWPTGQNVDYDYPVYRSLAQAPVLFSLLLHATLFACVLWCFRRSRSADRGWRVVGFGLAWFYVALAVESGVVPIADVIFEHRVYLPSAGFLLAVVAAAALTVPAARLRSAAIAGALVVLVLGVATVARNRVWQSRISLWADTVAKSPAKSRPLNSLGASYDLAGRHDLAHELYERAVEADPRNYEALVNLGSSWARRSRHAEAAAQFARALEVQWGSKIARQRLLEALASATRTTPASSPATGEETLGRLRLAARLRAGNQVVEAITEYEHALIADPHLPAAWVNLGNLYRESGHADLASLCLARAASLTPDDPIAHNGLGLALLAQGRASEAEAAYRRAIALEPRYAEALNNLGNLLLATGRSGEALEALRRAIEASPENPVIRSNWELAQRASRSPVPPAPQAAH